MDGFKEVIAFIGVLAGAFKMVTSGLKDLDELKEKRRKQKQKQNEKRRSPGKSKRRK